MGKITKCEVTYFVLVTQNCKFERIKVVELGGWVGAREMINS